MIPFSPFGISLGIIVPDNRDEIYEFFSRNSWINDIGKLPNVGAFVAEILEQSPAQLADGYLISSAIRFLQPAQFNADHFGSKSRQFIASSDMAVKGLTVHFKR
jgi:hypothetical protein